MTSGDVPTQRWLYGRRRGRALRPGQQVLRDTLLPVLRFALPESGAFDPRALFPRPVAGLRLEIGFGGGEHLAAQAQIFPDHGHIGCEVYENGVVKLLAEVERAGIGNLRLFIDDARVLVAALPDASLDRVFILFPDPWPKERHKKRRIVSPGMLDRLARVMTPEAELRVATDHPDYAEAMAACTAAHPAFAVIGQARGDWPERPADWPPSRYELKALAAGRPPLFVRLRRRATV